MPVSPARRASARPVALLVALALCACALVGITGCARNDTGPDLLNVVDVTPRALDVGDRLEVLGVNLPTAEAKEAIVTFRGELRRAGHEPLVDQEISADRGQLASDRVTLSVSDALVARFCGQGDDAMHTTFHGDITVSLPSNSELVVKGTVKDITLDLRPPTPRRAVIEAREREGQRALAFLGLTVSPEVPPSGGLIVTEVRASSPAAEAQIQAGDQIVRFEGASVLSVADMIPSGHEHLPVIAVKRGATPAVERRISIETYDIRPPSDLLGAGLVLAVAAAIILLLMAPSASAIAWIERRLSTRVASQLGPSRAGIMSLVSWIQGRARATLGGDLAAAGQGTLLARLAPYLVAFAASVTFLALPFSHLVAPDLDVGVLFIIAVTSLVTIGLMTGGRAPHASWSLLGGLRAAVQIVSCEIPSAIAIASIVVMTGSLRLEDIIAAQSGPGDAILTSGAWPWHWYVFRSPVTFALFGLYFAAVFAQHGRGRAPLPEADGELAEEAQAPGVRASFSLFAEWANVLVMSAVASALFLGGWQLPGISPAEQGARVGLEVLGALVFLVKSWALVLFVFAIRWTLPRVHDQKVLSLCWKWFVPLSLGAFACAALWTVLPPNRILELVISLATFTTAGLVAAYFVRRVHHNLGKAGAPLHLNPFL